MGRRHRELKTRVKSLSRDAAVKELKALKHEPQVYAFPTSHEYDRLVAKLIPLQEECDRIQAVMDGMARLPSAVALYEMKLDLATKRRDSCQREIDELAAWLDSRGWY
jgi:hypothetical protein